MDMNEQIIAKKYAHAFFETFREQIEHDYEKLDSVEKFLKKNNQFKFMSKLPASFNSAKKERATELLTSFKLNSPFSLLINLLVEHNRLFLLPLVIKIIIELYRTKQSLMHIALKSSPALNEVQYSTLKKFTEQQLSKKIIFEPSIDHSLIAGVRLQSDTILWEYSIAQQLNKIERLFDHEHKKF